MQVDQFDWRFGQSIVVLVGEMGGQLKIHSLSANRKSVKSVKFL